MNQQFFSSNYSKFYSKIFFYLKSKCKNDAEAEDLVQECFIKLWQNYDKIENGKESAYLYKIASNLFIDSKRKEKVRQRYIVANPLLNNYESPEFILIGSEFNEHIQVKLNSLPTQCKEVFLLNKVEKKSYSEIATIIGLSIKSVEKRMSYALKIFREIKNFNN